MDLALLIIILAPLFFYAGLVNQSRGSDRPGHIVRLKKLEQPYGLKIPWQAK